MTDDFRERKREKDRKAQQAVRQRAQARFAALEHQLLATQHQLLAAQHGAALDQERLVREILVLKGRNRDLTRGLHRSLQGSLNPDPKYHVSLVGQHTIEEDSHQAPLHISQSVLGELPLKPPAEDICIGPHGICMPETVSSTVLPPSEVAWPFDQILLALIDTQRDLLDRNTPVPEVIGPSRFQSAALALPDFETNIHVTHRVISAALSTFEEIRPPERLAYAWTLHRMLQVRCRDWTQAAVRTWS